MRLGADLPLVLDERERRPVLGARVDDLQVALHDVRASRAGTRQTSSRCRSTSACSLGDPVPDALNSNWPRLPPASWICSRKSRLWRHSPPTFTVWLPHQLGHRRRDAPGLLGAIPRQAGREAEHRRGEAVRPITMRDRPLVNSSMLAPGMPTSVLVLRPAPCGVATLW